MANTFQAPQPVLNIVELEDDFDTLSGPQIWNNAVARKPEPVLAKFTDDPVALSIQSYLIWKSNPHRRWVPLDEVGQVTPEARQMAHDLRTYFLHRGTMKVLQGQTPTEFQYKMNGLLSDIRPLQHDELGLLYRLPYFYQEDLALDKIFEGADQIETDGPRLYSVTSHTILTPIREVFKSRKNGDYIQFWFSDTSNQRCVYDVKSDNKLLSLFRSLFKQEKLAVTCYSKMEALRGSHIRTRYWRMTNLELV